MRKKGEKFASRVRPWFLLSRAPILNDICLSILNPDILMTACHLLTCVQSSTTKVNSSKKRARYDSGVQV